MKRVLKLLTISTLLLPLSVNADMGAPGMMPYKVVPKDTEGAPYYTCIDGEECVVEGNIPYKEEVEVYFEYEIDGEVYGDISINEEGYMIELKDFYIPDEEYVPDFDSEYKYDYKEEYDIYVSSTNGIKMRKGPSKAYDVVSTIPYGKSVKSTIINGDEGVAWAYVSYKGKSGWIYMLDHSAVYKTYPTRFYREVEVYDTIYNEEQKVIGTIPAQEIVKNIYTISEWTNIAGYYVEYNGIKGYVDDYFAAISEINQEKLDKLEIKANTKLYKYPDKKEVGKIDKKLVTSINGFYVTEEMDEEINDFVYETWLCVEYNDEYVWISESSLEKTSQNKFEEYLENRTEEDDYIQEIEKDTDKEEKEDTNQSTSNKKDKTTLGAKEIVILCVGGAVISALTAIVTIVLMNKKSKKKEVTVIEQPQVINNVENTNVQNNDQNNNQI